MSLVCYELSQMINLVSVNMSNTLSDCTKFWAAPIKADGTFGLELVHGIEATQSTHNSKWHQAAVVVVLGIQ